MAIKRGTAVKHALLTEKAVDLIEKENKLVFRVENRATKAEIKKDVEKLYKVKVVKVNTSIDMRGNKKAFVKLGKESSASDIATKLNIL
ncbi:MAG: 50S ribosomal protein L23 [Candidatus Diapherotrites archaeon]|nr:50S ribosomal protein L23 [Candidatus Diapherotrites archaeon]